MKKWHLLTTIVMLFGVMVFLVSTIQADTPQQSGLVAVLSIKSAEVEVKRANTDIWVALSMESLVGTGDMIRTGPNGSAELRFVGGDSLIVIDPNSELTILSMEKSENGNVVAFDVDQGKIRATLTTLNEENTSYQFGIDTVNVFSQGGTLELSVDAEATRLYTNEGAVFVTSQGQVTQVPAGTGVKVDESGLSNVIPTNSLATLETTLDGVTIRLETVGDVQLNVRQGPSLSQPILGALVPQDIDKTFGVSADGQWYRVQFRNQYGWISTVGVEVQVTTVNLGVFAMDYVETPIQTQAPTTTAAAEPAPLVPSTPPPTTSANTAPPAPTIKAPLDYSEEEVKMLAALNKWRVDMGLWGFQPNAVLTRMARDQARYVLAQPSIPNDVHIDAKGRYPRDRAVASEYAWPSYGIPQRVQVGENTYVGASVQKAIDWWRGSDIHNRTISNPTYREVGVAALPHPWGFLYVIVFGARPNVFPTLVDLKNNQIYFSGERSQYATGGDWIANIQQVQIIPSVLSSLEDNGWIAWSGQAALSQQQTFAVAFRDGDKRVILEVNPFADILWLPDNLDLLNQPQSSTPTTGNTTTPTTAATPNTQPSFFPTNTPTP